MRLVCFAVVRLIRTVLISKECFSHSSNSDWFKSRGRKSTYSQMDVSHGVWPSDYLGFGRHCLPPLEKKEVALWELLVKSFEVFCFLLEGFYIGWEGEGWRKNCTNASFTEVFRISSCCFVSLVSTETAFIAWFVDELIFLFFSKGLTSFSFILGCSISWVSLYPLLISIRLCH